MKVEIVLTPLKRKGKSVKLAEALIQSQISNIKSKIYAFIPVLSLLKFVPVKEKIYICTNGKVIFYNAGQIIEAAKYKNIRRVEQTILHILFHGMLGHFDETYWKEKKLSWAVQDIQVDRCMRMIYSEEELHHFAEHFLDEYICDELYFKGLKDRKFRKEVYFHGADSRMDDHSFWNAFFIDDNQLSIGEGFDVEAGLASDFWKKARESALGGKTIGNDGIEAAVKSALSQESHSHIYGHNSLNIENTVELVDQDSKSYKELLEKITRLSEVVKEEQELDKVLYQYGLELYGDVPLVEPEEISEKKCLHTLVVAVDTSGSCTHRAEKFFREVVAVFDEIKKVGSVQHISYLECDTEITMEKNYFSVDSFLDFGRTHTFRGGGGTEFDPVFAYADKLVEEGEQLDAVIYITDGCGHFPDYENGPEYPVYLLLDADEDLIKFVKDFYLPDWAEYITLGN